MKKSLLLMFLLLTPLLATAQQVEAFVSHQLQTYPKSRLIDIYKSCFQDYMGAEHLVSDRNRVKAYLDAELDNPQELDSMMTWYAEPCGINGNFVRVSLRCITEGFISEDQLLDAFIRSANAPRPAVESWREEWHRILAVIDSMHVVLPRMEKDRLFIDSILSAGKYAISHSPEYRTAYHPHYRIVARPIFEQEIKPLLKK